MSVAQLTAAQKIVPIVTVQNRYNLGDRAHEDVLDACEQRGIGFIPWFPLATGDLAQSGGELERTAAVHHAKPSQVALAWLLGRSPVMLPIPGTGSVAHLEENSAADRLRLTVEQWNALNKLKR